MTETKTIWNKIFEIRDSFYKHLENENSPHSTQILAEWYTFSSWIYSIYRKSFATRDDRKEFEHRFSLCTTNPERVNCIMECKPIHAKFTKYAKKLWTQTDVPAKNNLLVLRKWLKNGPKDGYLITYQEMPDPLEEIGRLSDPESGNTTEIHVKGSPLFEDYVENPSLKGVSKSVSLGNHEIKRRQLLANSDIQIGEIIAREDAICTWLAPTMYNTYCYRCLSILSNQRVTCRGCKIVNYCSIDCYQSARNEFHGQECGYMEMLRHLSICHFTLRLLILLDSDKVAAVSRCQFKSSKKGFDIGEEGDSVGTFLNLESGTSGVSQSDLLTFACTSMFTNYLIREMSIFDKSLPEKPLVCSLISMMILISRNIFTLYDHTFRLLKVPENPDFLVEASAKEIGYGLFYKTSLFNHSCRPNAHAVFFGGSILVIATKKIPANSEITISYGAAYPDMKLEDRQEKLRNNFYFNCLCEQCEFELNEQSKATVCKACSLWTDGCDVKNVNDTDDNEQGNNSADCTDCQSLTNEKEKVDKVHANGLSLYNKGRKLLAKEEYLRASRYFAKSVKLFLESNDLWYAYNSRDDLTICYRSLGEHDKAYINCAENLRLRARLYGSDSAVYLNALLITIELARDAENVDAKELDEMVGQFYSLHEDICSRQARLVDYTNQHYIDFLTHKKKYIDAITDLVNSTSKLSIN